MMKITIVKDYSPTGVSVTKKASQKDSQERAKERGA